MDDVNYTWNTHVRLLEQKYFVKSIKRMNGMYNTLIGVPFLVALLRAFIYRVSCPK